MPTINRGIKKKRDYSENKNRKDRQEIYSSEIWRNLRVSQLIKSPLCERCRMANKITAATEVHHLESFMKYKGELRLYYAYNPNNVASLCKQCHSEIHGLKIEVEFKNQILGLRPSENISDDCFTF